jgi:transposase
MPLIDGRKLDHKTLEHLRHLSVARVIGGERPSEVAKSLGFYRTSIYRWLRAHKKDGEEALRSRKAKGPTPKLNEKQKAQIAQWMVGKDPRQYGFDFGLWNRKLVGALIEEKFQVRVTLPTVGALLHSLGLTPQKPLRRAYERDEQAVEAWRQTEYPKLLARARREGAEIFFLDEAGVESDSPLGRTWGKKGETPIVKTSGQRQKVSVISAVNARGGFWFDVYTGKLNAERFQEFLGDFMERRPDPVFLVVDGLSVHKAKSVKRFLEEELAGRLELHFLPPYAPDLNPDEFVWSHLKTNGVSKRPLKKNESLSDRVFEDMFAIKKDKTLIKSFFQAPSVSYAISV